MACSDIVCGTGGWSGPKPGDPDNNSVLSAVPAYGGVDLSWTYPVTNSHAVSYINIFRGISDNPGLAIHRVICKGNFFFDRIPAAEVREYFYWIQFVSVNGTYGEWVGPVSAVPMLTITETIADLSGQIDEGILAESLRSKLGEITLLQGDLAVEITNRLAGSAAMAEALASVQSETGQALTYINNEITQREAADEALLTSVNTLAVGMGNNAAAIINESLARADLESAVALQIATVQTTITDSLGVTATAAVEVAMGAVLTTINGELDSLGAQYTAKVDVNGLIGGFGILNDGTQVEAGFDVDRFWVGKATDKIKPFIIDNGVVYINEAAIHYITADKIRAGSIGVTDYIGSLDYVPGQSGWRVNGSGNVEFNNGTFNGVVSAASVEAALGSANYYDRTTPGSYTIDVPAGLNADTIRIRIIGGSGGGGGGAGGTHTFYNYGTGGEPNYLLAEAKGGDGGNGGSGVSTEFTVPYTGARTFSVVVGDGGNGGSGGGTYDMYTYGVYAGYAGTNGSSGNPSSVVGIGSSSGGDYGAGGAPAPLSSNVILAFTGTNGADGGNSSGGIKGLGRLGIDGNPGAATGLPGAKGACGSVRITAYKGDTLVKETSYQALISWLDTQGHGAVPAAAR